MIRRWMYFLLCGLGAGVTLILLKGQDVFSSNPVAPSIYQKTTHVDDFSKRVNLLRDRCGWPLLSLVTYLAGNRKKSSGRILVDKHHNLSYCNVPKIGSSFWYSAFAILKDNRSHALSPYALWDKYGDDLQFKVKVNQLKQFPAKAQSSWLKSSKMFLFVRDPYARLFSAYVDKFVSPNSHYWLAAGKVIIRQVRSKPSLRAQRCGHEVSFKDFLRFFVATETGEVNHPSDHHWTPIYRLCSPCQFDYDFIGKTETFLRDTTDIIKSAKLEEKIDFQNNGVSSIEADIKNSVEKFLTHSLKLKSCVEISKDVWRLWYAFNAKGYIKSGSEIPRITKPLTPATVTMHKNNLYQQALELYKRQLFPGSRELYRKQVLTEAFNDIPQDLLLKVRKMLLPDFLLFGYDPQPENLFPDQSIFNLSISSVYKKL